MYLLTELEVWIKKKGIMIVSSIVGLNLAMLSVLSGFQSILGLQQPTVNKLLLAALAVDLVVVAAVCFFRFARGSRDTTPPDPVLPSQFRYYVAPSTESDVRWAAQLAAIVYGGYDVIPENVMLNWYNANSNGFYVVKRDDGTNVGNLDLLPVRPNTLKEFIAGELLEKEILGDSLFGPGEKASVRDVYVESLVIPPHLFQDKYSNSFALYAVIASLMDCILNLCEQSSVAKGEIKVYALSANKVVAKRLTEMGFGIVSAKDKRRDGHDLYCLEFRALQAQLKKFADRRDGAERLRRSEVSVTTGL
jgi:hypothetical protein